MILLFQFKYNNSSERFNRSLFPGSYYSSGQCLFILASILLSHPLNLISIINAVHEGVVTCNFFDDFFASHLRQLEMFDRILDYLCGRIADEASALLEVQHTYVQKQRLR